jgi:spore coat protein CotH
MVLSLWDGYFNNYFTYHDTQGTKKWEMYPWDQDNTWGLRGPFGEDVFFDMPLNFGADGALPPGVPEPAAGEPVTRPRDFRGFGGPGGRRGPGWWRPPGYFSGPLLANPQFRQVFLAKTREVLEKVYTEETYFPLIDTMAARIQEDVVLRAKAMGRESESSTRTLERVVERLKLHLTKRRQFLLEQAELRALAPVGTPQAERLGSSP